MYGKLANDLARKHGSPNVKIVRRVLAGRRPRNFDEWMKRVNEFLVARCSFTADDLPDVPYRQWYDDRVTASVAAQRAMKNANDEGI